MAAVNATLDEAEDLALIRRYVDQDDRDALGLLFQRHSELAFRMAVRVMRNPSEAEDAVQATFVQIVRDIRHYRGGQGVRTWITKAVMGTCHKIIRGAVRRRDREERQAPAEGDPAGSRGLADELAERVKQALDGLPEHYRLPVWLHYYEGMPFEEVADVVAAPEGTVRSQASRGIEMLRQHLARAGVSVSAVALLDALPSMPAEAAPSSLLGSVSEIARGLGTAAERFVAAKTAWAGGGHSLAKAGWAMAVVAASAAVVGTGVYLSGPPERATSPTVSRAAQSANVLFQEDFDSGMDRWETKDGGWSIADGKGVGNSRCLAIHLSGTRQGHPRIWTRAAMACNDVEVDFKIRFETLPSPASPVLSVGLFFKEPGGRPGSEARAFWLLLAHPASTRLFAGKWLEYRCAIRGQDISYRVFVEGRQVAEWDPGETIPSGERSLELSVGSLQADVDYFIDDVVVKKLESAGGGGE